MMPLKRAPIKNDFTRCGVIMSYCQVNLTLCLRHLVAQSHKTLAPYQKWHYIFEEQHSEMMLALPFLSS